MNTGGFVLPIKVYYYDTDAGGVVHNVAYLRMIEQARTELAAHLGWSLKDMAETGLVPVVTRTEIDYIKPARLADELEIHARLAEVERVRFYLEFEILRPKDGQMIARCRQTMVTVQLPEGRPEPVPAVLRSRNQHSAR
jgi:tol-pal system-associated acyl-CoA thioesterase